MECKDDLKIFSDNYPQVPLLDLIYYEIKGRGISYEDADGKRPKLHLLSEDHMFSIVPLSSMLSSPYILNSSLLRFNKKVPLKVKIFPRIKTQLGYFYLRSSEEWIQTLDSAIILNTNFNPKCSGCQFCSRGFDRYANADILPITPEEGIRKILTKGIDFSQLSEIAIVTGNFFDEYGVIEHIRKIKDIATAVGFKGRFFYLGCQIRTSNGVKKLLNILKNSPFRYAYTIELFSCRNILHSIKMRSLDECINDLKLLNDNGVVDLEYTYMPGLDNLTDFYKWSSDLSSLGVCPSN